MQRKEYWVVWNNSYELWYVKEAGNDKVIKDSKDKECAILSAVVLAKQNQPSQLLIKNKDGKIADERTYGNDPFPPRG